MMRRIARLAGLTFAAALCVALPAAAGTLGLSVTPSEIHPGDEVTVAVSGAPPGSRLVVFASLDPTPTTLGPIETRCGTFQLDLGLTPRLRFSPLRPDPDGGASVSFNAPMRLPARLNGITIYAQAASALFVPDHQGGCSLTTCLSDLASATIVVP